MAAAPTGGPRAHKGRGALTNSDGRFETLTHEGVDDGWLGSGDETSSPRTRVVVDTSKSVIARNDSPDVPFEQSVNPYRGCEHGCVYCYARPTHAYLGYSAGLDFETRIVIKPDAARRLEAELARPSYRCRVIAMGTNTDPYQPLERQHGITRDILDVLSRHHHPVSIVTKSSLIERDLALLASLAARQLVHVGISVTSLDEGLTRRLEPRAAAPRRRLKTIARLAEAGVPVMVLVAPVIPALNDRHIEEILAAAAAAGARSADYILLRLPLEVKVLFREWLEEHEPLRAEHVMSLVRQMRQGRENDATFGRRLRGSGAYAELIGRRFRVAARRHGLDERLPSVDTTRFRRPATAAGQLSLF